jgi:hypothetical protein
MTNLVSTAGSERTYRLVMRPDQWPGVYGTCHPTYGSVRGLDGSEESFPDEDAFEAVGLHSTLGDAATRLIRSDRVAEWRHSGAGGPNDGRKGLKRRGVVVAACPYARSR